MATQEDPEITPSTDVPNLHLFIEQLPLKDGGRVNSFCTAKETTERTARETETW